MMVKNAVHFEDDCSEVRVINHLLLNETNLSQKKPNQISEDSKRGNICQS